MYEVAFSIIGGVEAILFSVALFCSLRAYRIWQAIDRVEVSRYITLAEIAREGRTCDDDIWDDAKIAAQDMEIRLQRGRFAFYTFLAAICLGLGGFLMGMLGVFIGLYGKFA